MTGDIEVSTGEGLSVVMLKVSAEEVPPPGVGLKTVTEAAPGAATSAAGMAAWSRVLLTNVVGRLSPFQRTFEAATKRLPTTVSVNPGEPGGRALGESAINVGTGLGVLLSSRVAVLPVAFKVMMSSLPSLLRSPRTNPVGSPPSPGRRASLRKV